MTAQGQTMRYSLQKFKETIFNGFDFAVPETAVNIINYLSANIQINFRVILPFICTI